MLSINTNLSSLIVQSSMNSSTDKLNLAIERMTTGYKINHAKDNAANYSISTNMQTRLGALRVAEDNTQQAIEMMSTTTESLNQISDKLARMRALSLQSMNGTFEVGSLEAINAEVNSILKEINRINECAEYDGIKLFNTGKKEVTNAGKDLELNEQGFLQEVVKVDTTGMTPLSAMADDVMLSVGEYSISNVDELVQLQEMANAGLVEAGSTFVLTENIDIGAYCKSKEATGGWVPMKLSGSSFNGNGYTIKGLYINRNEDYQAFAYSVEEIKNLKLEDVDIVARSHVGGIGAYRAKANNCVVEGSISGKNHVGGVIGGYYSGYARYCYADVNVKGESSVGGIFGYANYADVRFCFSEGTVKGIRGVGGILGSGDEVRNCKSLMKVSGEDSVGGITGIANRSQLENYFEGKVVGVENVGGLIGVMRSSNSIKDSIMAGTVSGTTNTGIMLGSAGASTSLSDNFYYMKNAGSENIVGDMTNVSLTNLQDITIPCDYTFQVGVTAETITSSVSYTTYIEFGGLKDLLVSGIDSEQFLIKIDELVNIVSLKQTELGTMENRLCSVLDEISTQYDNLLSSYSTIRDADIAEVSSQYIQQQILQQAAATLMATANQSPAIALQLI